MKQCTREELERIYREQGAYTLNSPYRKEAGHGLTVLLDNHGDTVRYYCVDNLDEFASWVNSLDNVGRALNHPYVDIYKAVSE